jgi:uncharacterized protein YjbI with pentapeptide repeats
MFNGAILEATSFDRVRGMNYKFHNAKLNQMKFTNLNMTNGELRHCKVHSALFSECNLTSFRFDKTDVSRIIFFNCKENNQPVTVNWLIKQGAINANQAAITSSAEESSDLVKSSFFLSRPLHPGLLKPGPWRPVFVFPDATQSGPK